jgi:hypothetical protein
MNAMTLPAEYRDDLEGIERSVAQAEPEKRQEIFAMSCREGVRWYTVKGVPQDEVLGRLEEIGIAGGIPPSEVQMALAAALANPYDPSVDGRRNAPDKSSNDPTEHRDARQAQDAGDHNLRPTPIRFPLVPFEALRPGIDPPYLVKGLIPRAGLTVAWGPPKCGKSFWAFDLAMRVALGWDYRGRRTQGGPVVYCAFEGADGFKNRAEAFRQRNLIEHTDPVSFALSPTPMDLVADHAALISDIRNQAGDHLPVLIVLDTLNRSLRGSESDDRDMTAYIKAADALREAFACAVLIVHHCGIDTTRPRGHTPLAGAVDAQLAVKRDQEDKIVVTVERMKDGAEGDTITSALEIVEVGTDSDDDTLYSCVVVETEASSRPAKNRQRMTDKQKLALDALDEVILSHGQTAPSKLELPTGNRAAERDLWREEMFRRGVLDPAASNPREDFRRLRFQLEARSLIGELDGLVWKAARD